MYTTIFDSRGSSSLDASVDEGSGNGGRGASNNERSAGAYKSANVTDHETGRTHHGDIGKYRR